MKKILTILMAFIMVLGMSITVLAENPAGSITRGEFIASITGYFGWPHWDEYNDVWKDDPRTFDDISGHKFQRAIETAFEEGIVGPSDFQATRLDGIYGSADHPNSGGNFRPDEPITREDAAVMLARAFKLDVSDIVHGYSDNDAFSNNESRGSVAALAKLGLLGTVTGDFNPTDSMDKDEALALFEAMKDGVVAPVYFLPRATTAGYAPRRNVKLYTANPAAEIYVTRGTGTPDSIADPVPGTASQRYIDVQVNANTGYLGYNVSGQEPTIKAVVVDRTKTVLTTSAVAQETWRLYRPSKAEFQQKEIFAKNELAPGSPRVVRIMNEQGEYAPMAWYIEGSERAIMFESLQTGTGSTQGDNLRNFIVNSVASSHIKENPYDNLMFVGGHSHPDHNAQDATFRGHNIYRSPQYGTISGQAGWTPEEQARIHNLSDGDTLDLGDAILYAYPLPGHQDSLMTLQHKESGMVFATDVYGCTRTGTADDVAIAGLKSDLMLSLIQQTHSKYKTGGEMKYLFTGHDETTLGEENFKIFEEAFQLLIDEGYQDITHASHRQARIGANTRTLTIGDIYPNLPGGQMIDPTMTAARLTAIGGTEPTPTVEIPAYRRYRGATQWISVTFGGPAVGSTTAPNYLSSNTGSSENWSRIQPGTNYNTANATGASTYSQLSNIEFVGAELVGVDFQWNATSSNVIPNMFHPWNYDYTINVPTDKDTISVIPTTLSTKVTSIKLNGKEVAYRSSNNVKVENGTVITIDVVAPDGVTTSTYTFTVAKEASTLVLSTNAHLPQPGGYFALNAKFSEKTASNAVVLTYTFDEKLFEYAGFTSADGVTMVEQKVDQAQVTLMITGYDAENLGDILLRVKEDAKLLNKKEVVKVAAQYVVKDEAGVKTILDAEASASVYTKEPEPIEVIDLIYLSNVIDMFGKDSSDPKWESTYVFHDYNNNGEIDISDIAHVAKLIK